MKGKPLSRWTYLIIFIGLALASALAKSEYPDLTKDAVNTLGSLGFWITLYGLIIAILEIMRTGSVTRKMAHVAEASHNRLKRQIEHHEVQSCLEFINSALHDLTGKKAVSVIFISRIKQGYISSFSRGRAPERYDENLAILNSYEHVAQSRTHRSAANPNYATNQYPKAKPSAGDHPYKLTIETLKRMHDELSTHSASKNEYIGDPT